MSIITGPSSDFGTKPYLEPAQGSKPATTHDISGITGLPIGSLDDTAEVLKGVLAENADVHGFSERDQERGFGLELGATGYDPYGNLDAELDDIHPWDLDEELKVTDIPIMDVDPEYNPIPKKVKVSKVSKKAKESKKAKKATKAKKAKKAKPTINKMGGNIRNTKRRNTKRRNTKRRNTKRRNTKKTKNRTKRNSSKRNNQ
jgi:hypothetical protein